MAPVLVEPSPVTDGVQPLIPTTKTRYPVPMTTQPPTNRPGGPDWVNGDSQTSEGIETGTAKAVLGVLCGFQLATAIVVLVMSPSAQAGAYAAVAGWGWLALAVALVAGPLLFRWRLLRV